MRKDFVSIPGYSRYEITSDGIVRKRYNCVRYQETKDQFGLIHFHQKNYKQKIIQHVVLKAGVFVSIQKDGERKQSLIGVHRLIMFAHGGENKGNRNYVFHVDGNNKNNKLENLCWVNNLELRLYKRIMNGEVPFKIIESFKIKQQNEIEDDIDD